MGNRRRTVLDRRTKFYQNMNARAQALSSQPQRKPNGDWRRGEGRHNIPHGVMATGHGLGHGLGRRGVRRIQRYLDRHHGREPWLRKSGQAVVEMTRDQLRALCKDSGVTGYGKMTKAQMIEALR